MGKTNYLTSLSSKGYSCEILVDKDVGYKTFNFLNFGGLYVI